MTNIDGFLIDACVMIDLVLSFRERHEQAVLLFKRVNERGIKLYIPSHAYFEYAAAVITHFKHEPDKLIASPVKPELLPKCDFEVITLSKDYVDELFSELRGKPQPDLKSQDMIYFCIARRQSLWLITEDKKLRRTAIAGGVTALTISEAITYLTDPLTGTH